MALTVLIIGVARRFDIHLTEEEAIALSGLLFIVVGWLVREEAPPAAAALIEKVAHDMTRKVLPI
jgi:hypothetical protein